MAKKNVSARVPPRIADGIDEYAELYDLTRTEAMTLILEAGLEDPPHPKDVEADSRFGDVRPVYTLSIEPRWAERIDEYDGTAEGWVNSAIRTACQYGFNP
jgi:hypothetical protein